MIPGLWKKCLFAGLRQPAFVHFCRYTPQGDVGYAYIKFNYLELSKCYTPQGDVGYACWDIAGLDQAQIVTPRKGT